jgi:hypothetical protein
MSVKSPFLDDPDGDAAFGWAIARTVLAAAIYLTGRVAVADPVADAYVRADHFMNRLAKDLLESQKREELKP